MVKIQNKRVGENTILEFFVFGKITPEFYLKLHQILPHNVGAATSLQTYQGIANLP